VTRSALQGCIREIRVSLADEFSAPQYIETIGRKGYRFIAPIRYQLGEIHDYQRGNGNSSHYSTSVPQSLTPSVVGRDAELNQLVSWMENVLQGDRQVVFVTGELGIGKTTLAGLFLSFIRTDRKLRIGSGQCLEQYGEGEAYLPVLEAFSRLCREPDGEYVLTILRHYAPSWLVQMPALVSDAEWQALQQKVQGVTQKRMLREMAEAIEAIAAQQPFVLVLEDLHWSDYSTLELVTYLAQRTERAKLLVIGTYRPTDVVVNDHPLKSAKQQLQIHGRCIELPLALLTEQDISAYLPPVFQGVFSQQSFPERFISVQMGMSCF
jgi:predicted ATPase